MLDNWLDARGIEYTPRWQDVFNRALHDRATSNKSVLVMAGGPYTRGEALAAEAGREFSNVVNIPYWPSQRGGPPGQAVDVTPRLDEAFQAAPGKLRVEARAGGRLEPSELSVSPPIDHLGQRQGSVALGGHTRPAEMAARPNAIPIGRDDVPLTTLPQPLGRTQATAQARDASPSGGPPGARGRARAAPRGPVVLYRGTVHQWAEGSRPGAHIHDLGDGMYMTPNKELGVRYAQERRLEVQASNPGTPGVVFGARVAPDELGRTFDFFNDRKLRQAWEDYLRKQPLGDVVMKGGSTELYNGYFESWLKSLGKSLDDFDTIIGPEYTRGGAQVCVRNQSTAERIRASWEEVARAHEPVVPAYPDPGVPVTNVSE